MFAKKEGPEKASAPVSIQKDERPDDDLGRFPAEVDNNPSKSRSHERALRAVSIVAIVSSMTTVALSMLLITLFPLRQVVPYLVTFKDKEQQTVNIEPISIDAPGIVYATEDAVRDYVTQRHSFVPIEATMKAQWGADSRLAARTTSQLYSKFADAAKNETQQMMTAGYARTVEVNSVQRINEDTWQVNFTTKDSLPTMGGTLTGDPQFGSQPSTGSGFGTPGNPTEPVVSQVNDQQWIATMRVEYQPQRVTYAQRLLNPLGFTVVDYSVSRTTR